MQRSFSSLVKRWGSNRVLYAAVTALLAVRETYLRAVRDMPTAMAEVLHTHQQREVTAMSVLQLFQWGVVVIWIGIVANLNTFYRKYSDLLPVLFAVIAITFRSLIELVYDQVFK